MQRRPVEFPMQWLPEISDGALYLLEVARGNDKERAMAKNAALLAVLEFGEELVRVSRGRNLPALFSLVEAATPPQNFLVMTAAILRRVAALLDERKRDPGRGAALPVIIEFNTYVLQGFAQALADLTWPERTAHDFDGPAVETFLLMLSRHDAEALWSSTLQHYVANIFQDFFAALRVRERAPDLPPDTEAELRELDARILAESAMRIAATAAGGAQPTPEAIISSLDEAIDELLKGEDAG